MIYELKYYIILYIYIIVYVSKNQINMINVVREVDLERDVTFKS